MSDNLNVTPLTTNQSGKEVTINDAFSDFDAALTERLAVDLTNDVTLTSAQYRSAIYFDITTTGAGKKLTLPLVRRFVAIKNNGTQAVTIKVGTTEIALPIKDEGLVYTDGTTNGLSMTVIGSGLPAGGVGVPVAATQTLTFASNAANGETVTLGSQTYTFQTTFTAGLGHVKIGAASIDSLTNLARCINQSGAGAGTLYDNSVTTQNADASATEASPMVALARSTGSQGNSIATTETLANGAWGAATMTGGKSKQFLGKVTDADFDVAWQDPPVSAAGGGGGGGGGSVVLPERTRVVPTTSTLATVVNGTGLVVTNVSSGINLAAPSFASTSNHNRGVTQAVPGVDFTAYARFTRGWVTKDFFRGGLMLRESATSKITALYVGGDHTVETVFSLQNWTDPDTFSAVVVRTASEPAPGTWWVKLVYVSGSTPNYSFFMSFDGISWFLVGTQNKTTFFTTNADQVGVTIDPALSSGTDTLNLTVNSWEITTP